MRGNERVLYVPPAHPVGAEEDQGLPLVGGQLDDLKMKKKIVERERERMLREIESVLREMRERDRECVERD